ncbi:MAG: glycosyltransferase [Lachnospiraceae bacterium]|nr:glycosyltransferase [Lachnospiraceae bacterium]
MERKKLVLIGPVYPYKGGISHYTSLMYRALSKKHDVTMVSYKMQYPKLLFRKEQKDYQNDSFRIKETEYLIHTANPFNIARVGAYIRRMKPDMVLIQWWHPYFAPCYWILNHIIGREKIVYVCHNVFPHERFPLDKLLTKWVLRGGRGFLLHATEEEKELSSIFPRKRGELLAVDETQNGLGERPKYQMAVTPHPTYHAFRLKNLSKAQARECLEVDEKQRMLLFFGFVREYKGLRYLLEAMGKLQKQDIQLWVVGDFGDDRESYISMIKEKELDGAVRIVEGYVPDDEVEKYFAACDLVVLPYLSATQSGIVQIAYGFEKPVVVTDVGGLPEVVTNGKTGYVVKSADTNALVSAIIKYFEEDKEKEFTENIRKESYRFSWERMSEVIEGFL